MLKIILKIKQLNKFFGLFLYFLCLLQSADATNMEANSQNMHENDIFLGFDHKNFTFMDAKQDNDSMKLLISIANYLKPGLMQELKWVNFTTKDQYDIILTALNNSAQNEKDNILECLEFAMLQIKNHNINLLEILKTCITLAKEYGKGILQINNTNLKQVKKEIEENWQSTLKHLPEKYKKDFFKFMRFKLSAKKAAKKADMLKGDDEGNINALFANIWQKNLDLNQCTTIKNYSFNNKAIDFVIRLLNWIAKKTDKKVRKIGKYQIAYVKDLERAVLINAEKITLGFDPYEKSDELVQFDNINSTNDWDDLITKLNNTDHIFQQQEYENLFNILYANGLLIEVIKFNDENYQYNTEKKQFINDKQESLLTTLKAFEQIVFVVYISEEEKYIWKFDEIIENDEEEEKEENDEETGTQE